MDHLDQIKSVNAGIFELQRISVVSKRTQNSSINWHIFKWNQISRNNCSISKSYRRYLNNYELTWKNSQTNSVIIAINVLFLFWFGIISLTTFHLIVVPTFQSRMLPLEVPELPVYVFGKAAWLNGVLKKRFLEFQTQWK